MRLQRVGQHLARGDAVGEVLEQGHHLRVRFLVAERLERRQQRHARVERLLQRLRQQQQTPRRDLDVDRDLLPACVERLDPEQGPPSQGGSDGRRARPGAALLEGPASVAAAHYRSDRRKPTSSPVMAVVAIAV